MNQISKETIVFGVEGPAGSGKSTMANVVGHEMGIPVIEGGRYYRQLTYAALNDGIDLDNTAELVHLAETMPSQFTSFDDGEVLYNGSPISDALNDEKISTKVSQVSKQLEVRAVIEAQIKSAVCSYDVTITVGRAVKKLFPDAFVLHVEINPEEAERRHLGRAGEKAQSVRERNETDARTAQILGVIGDHEASIDVTNLTLQEQAGAMRDFILSHRS